MSQKHPLILNWFIFDILRVREYILPKETPPCFKHRLMIGHREKDPYTHGCLFSQLHRTPFWILGQQFPERYVNMRATALESVGLHISCITGLNQCVDFK